MHNIKSFLTPHQKGSITQTNSLIKQTLINPCTYNCNQYLPQIRIASGIGKSFFFFQIQRFQCCPTI